MMPGVMDMPAALQLLLSVLLGYAIAAVHLRALASNVRLYLQPGALWRPVVMHVTRLMLVVAALAAAAAAGAAVLLAVLAGFTLGRLRTSRYAP